MKTNRVRWLLAATAVLVVAASFAPCVVGAKISLFPRAMFTRAFDLTRPVYVEVSIADGPSVKITLAAGQKTGRYALEGVAPGKNYILVAKASNDPLFAPDKTQVLKALVRNADFKIGLEVIVVNINSVSTALTDAVVLYCDNTGIDLNDPAIEADLALIVAAPDPLAKAIELSTTQVSGTVQNVNGATVSGATVATVGCINAASSVTDSGGSFTLMKVPIRCTRLEATSKPRYFPAQSDAIVLKGGTILTGVSIVLRPDPAAAYYDILEAATLMGQDPSSRLGGYLSSGFTFTADGGTLSRDVFLTNVHSMYSEMSWSKSSYQAQVIDDKTVTFAVSAWITRDAATKRRTAYQAGGGAVFEGSVWSLTPLTLSNGKELPVAPAIRATGGDGSATLTWTASSDSLVTGYNIYRTSDTTAPVEGAVPVKTLAKNVTSYVDTPLTTGDYYYWMRAVEGYTDPVTGVVSSVLGPLSSSAFVHVFSSRTTVEAFMTCALNRDSVEMAKLLSDSFQATVPGSAYKLSKTAFINWLLDVFSLDSASPAKLWRVDSAIKADGFLKVKAFQVGKRLSEVRNARLDEEEWWEVVGTETSATITQFIVPSNPVIYPLAPLNFECANPDRAGIDSVILTWVKPPDPEIKGYRVLRCQAPDYVTGATWFPSETSLLPADQTTFTDSTTVAGTTYFYWVIAYDNYDVDTMTEQNMNNYVQIGLPTEVREAALAFLDSSARNDEAGVRATVTPDFQAFRESMLYTLDAYCTAVSSSATFSLQPTYGFAKYDPNAVLISYNCSLTWNGGTAYNWVEILLVNVNGVWKAKLATFVAM